MHLLSKLFPDTGKILLTGTGKQFVERIGVETVRQVILSVMMGENIRNQTEPLSRRRIAQISGALVVLFARGCLQTEDFIDKLSPIAAGQLTTAKKNDIVAVWPAQWLLGLTNKAVQNVLRNDHAALDTYLRDFDLAIKESAFKCRKELGDIRMSLGFIEDKTGRQIALDWEGIIRLTTAIGSQTLTIRGSDKSLFGKLFERLILGSFLTIMDFERVNPLTNNKTENVFWLSDSSDIRESDATLLIRPGKLARFDIGFIGPGNSEISKDKLSRFARELETDSGRSSSVTFIVVDRLPNTGKTKKAAEKIGAEIIQMSMQYWPKDLAIRLGRRLKIKHELQNMPDNKIRDYMASKLSTIPVQDFLSTVSFADIEAEITEEETL
ncbi:CfrBI family restriction endonuclease [bacterium]|nr:CfrBI family restriction endonuclease [bacterium]